ncbi:hypothetical protein C8Q80DRAFT_1196945 [Daedaleopsis nitida]|nr:hypothetical protein C8Q80DRAFT_1196945 [Daedaleopsis nitida]
MYWHHMHPYRRCGRAYSRLFWFLLGAGTATWWNYHRESHAWSEARRCWRDRIPQNAYPAPGVQGQENSSSNSGNAPPPAPGTVDKWDRWGWGHWGKGSWPGQEEGNGWDRWGRNRTHSNPRPEGAWGPPTPLPGSRETPEKDAVQQATDTVSDRHIFLSLDGMQHAFVGATVYVSSQHGARHSFCCSISVSTTDSS